MTTIGDSSNLEGRTWWLKTRRMCHQWDERDDLSYQIIYRSPVFNCFIKPVWTSWENLRKPKSRMCHREKGHGGDLCQGPSGREIQKRAQQHLSVSMLPEKLCPLSVLWNEKPCAALSLGSPGCTTSECLDMWRQRVVWKCVLEEMWRGAT